MHRAQILVVRNNAVRFREEIGARRGGGGLRGLVFGDCSGFEL